MKLVKNCPFVNSSETKTLHLMQLQQKGGEVQEGKVFAIASTKCIKAYMKRQESL